MLKGKYTSKIYFKQLLHYFKQLLHYFKQLLHYIFSRYKAKTLETNLKDEEGRVYCGACGKQSTRKNLGRHFKDHECERSLLQIGSTLTGKPWNSNWKSFIPEQYRHEVFSNSDPAEEDNESEDEED